MISNNKYSYIGTGVIRNYPETEILDPLSKNILSRTLDKLHKIVIKKYTNFYKMDEISIIS